MTDHFTPEELDALQPHPDFVAAYEALRGPRTLSVEERVRRFIDNQESNGDCLVWTGVVTPSGYGTTTVAGKTLGAHQFAYWMYTGQRPPEKASGLNLDHLCRNRTCVNPLHLELVTQAVNNNRSESITAKLARATACKRGHEWTPENTRITPRGHRDCRACAREHARKSYYKRTAKP